MFDSQPKKAAGGEDPNGAGKKLKPPGLCGIAAVAVLLATTMVVAFATAAKLDRR